MPGDSGDNGLAINAQISAVQGLQTDTNGNLYVADGGNCAIRVINKASGIITTIAGNGTCGIFGDDYVTATSAQLKHPHSLSVDSVHNVFIADTGNNKIRMVSSAGIIRTIAGTGDPGSSGDGDFATNAQLNSPNGVVADNSKNVYIADTFNYVIRKVSSGNIITTMDVGTLYYPIGCTLDQSGNLYVVDTGSNVVVKVTISSSGIVGSVSIVAGTFSQAGYSGDGGSAIDARLYYPSSVTLDSVGNMFIVDSYNKVIRFVAYDTGIITTYAGGGMSMGDGASATSAYLVGPTAVTVDASGALYIADTNGYRIRMVVPGTFNFPTHQPTTQPTSQPSKPSGQPTEQPTGKPSKFVWHPKQSVRRFFPYYS